MVILIWTVCLILFLVLSGLLIASSLGHPETKEAVKTIINGFKEGLRGSGFWAKGAKYPVELWKWETMDDDEVCEDCLERASWPPMDIADWMKEGLPRTPEAETECSDECRCHLVPFKPKAHFKKHIR